MARATATVALGDFSRAPSRYARRFRHARSPTSPVPSRRSDAGSRPPSVLAIVTLPGTVDPPLKSSRRLPFWTLSPLQQLKSVVTTPQPMALNVKLNRP